MTRRWPGSVVVAGDVGGTKTILAAYDTEDVRAPSFTRTYESRTLSGLDEALADLLGRGPRPVAAAFAVAGPVHDNAAQITNLAFRVDGPRIAARFSIPSVEVLNDVAALAVAVDALTPDERTTLQDGVEDPTGPRAVLALGTGLGMAYVTHDGGTMRVHPSEGGHGDFAPSAPLHDRLLARLRREFDHVSVERIASGLGLPRLHRFLIEDEGWCEDPTVLAALASATDPTPTIVHAALSGASPVCREAVALLCDAVAAEAGNFALKTLATGGVVLGGGLAARLLPVLAQPRALAAFRAKGRFTPWLAGLPVRAVIVPDAILWGAALRAMRRARETT